MYQLRVRMECSPSLSVMSAADMALGKSWTANIIGNVTRNEQATALEYLLVRKYQKDGISQLVLTQHPVQLVPCFGDTVPVITVHNKDQSLGVHVVVTPERPDLVLATHIPYSEVDILVFNRFDIKADGRDRCDIFSELELVKDRCFTSSVQANHEDSDIFL